jgi:rhamnulose-1-phosphate aldolase
MIKPPYPEFDDLLHQMGQAGRHLADIGACEGAAGNISIFVGWPIDVTKLFPVLGEIKLPQPVPELAGGTFIVTGSGRRLREIIDEPTANLACIVVNQGGQTGKLYTSADRRFERVTSEFNSHVGVHYDQIMASGSNFQAVIHAQPIHLTHLSHIARYQDEKYLNTHLLRWQPETIINLPEGIGFLPFCVPGSPNLMAGNVELLRTHRIVVWAKHGVMVHSDLSIKHAADFIEYAETGATYEYYNLTVGEIGDGLNADEIRGICTMAKITQDIF